MITEIEEKEKSLQVKDEEEIDFKFIGEACIRGLTLDNIKKIAGEGENFKRDVLETLLAWDTISPDELTKYARKTKNTKLLRRKRYLKRRKMGVRDNKQLLCYSSANAFKNSRERMQFVLWRDEEQRSEPTITIKEAMQITKLSRQHLHELYKENKLAKISTRITIPTLSRYIKKHISKLNKEIEKYCEIIKNLESTNQI